MDENLEFSDVFKKIERKKTWGWTFIKSHLCCGYSGDSIAFEWGFPQSIQPHHDTAILQTRHQIQPSRRRELTSDLWNHHTGTSGTPGGAPPHLYPGWAPSQCCWGTIGDENCPRICTGCEIKLSDSKAKAEPAGPALVPPAWWLEPAAAWQSYCRYLP